MTEPYPKAVIYCRVSDPKQKTEGHGLESQEIRCRHHALYRHYDVVKAFHGRIASAKTRAATLKIELQKIERGIEQFIDRVMLSDSPSLVAAYESRIKSLEEEKTSIRENIAKCGTPLRNFDASFRTAMEFLGNPLAYGFPTD